MMQKYIQHSAGAAGGREREALLSSSHVLVGLLVNVLVICMSASTCVETMCVGAHKLAPNVRNMAVLVAQSQWLKR